MNCVSKCNSLRAITIFPHANLHSLTINFCMSELLSILSTLLFFLLFLQVWGCRCCNSWQASTR